MHEEFADVAVPALADAEEGSQMSTRWRAIRNKTANSCVIEI